MSETHSDINWSRLIEIIRDGRCLPFLGAGMSSPPLPIGTAVAADCVREYNYPGDNPRDLAEVAQFIAVHLICLPP